MYPFLVAVLALLGGAVGLRAFVRNRREARRISEFAEHQGLNYTRDDLIGLHERYNRLELIRQGHSRSVRHVIYGRRPVGLVTVFQYTYELGLGVNSSTRECWMAIVETPGTHEHWRAAPAGEVDAESWPVERGGMRFRADREATLAALPGEVERILVGSAGVYAEAWGPLVAVAMPGESAGPQQVLDTACRLSQTLSR